MNDKIKRALEKNEYFSLKKTLETLENKQGFSWFIIFQEEIHPDFKNFYLKWFLNIIDKPKKISCHWNIKYLIYLYLSEKDLNVIKKILEKNNNRSLSLKFNSFFNFKKYLTINEFNNLFNELKKIILNINLEEYGYEKIKKEPVYSKEEDTKDFLKERQEEPLKLFENFKNNCLLYSEKTDELFKIKDENKEESLWKEINSLFIKTKDIYKKLWFSKYRDLTFKGPLLQAQQYWSNFGSQWDYSYYCNGCFTKWEFKEAELLDDEWLYCKKCSKLKISNTLKKSKFKSISNSQIINYLTWVSKFSFNQNLNISTNIGEEDEKEIKNLKIDLFELNELILEEAIERNLIFKDSNSRTLTDSYFIFSKNFKINDNTISAGSTRLNRYPLSYIHAISINEFIIKMNNYSLSYQQIYNRPESLHKKLSLIKKINKEVVPFKLYWDYNDFFEDYSLYGLTYDVLGFWSHKNDIPTPPFWKNNIQKIAKDLYKINKNLSIFK